MKKPMPVAVLIVLVIFTAVPATAESAWEEAVALSEANEDDRPERMLTVTEELGRDGEVKSREEILYGLSYGEGDEPHVVIIRAEKNGDDVTAERRRDQEKARNGNGGSTFSFSQANPFEEELQKKVDVSPSDARRLRNGLWCRAYSFRMPLNETEMVGTAWIEEDRGIPAVLEFTLEPLPKFVSELTAVVAYEFEGPDRWHIRRMSFEASGGFLFVKKHFRSSTEFFFDREE